MRALIKRTFINRGRRYRKGVHDFPDDVKLPRDAVEVDEKGKPVLKKGQKPGDVNMSTGPDLNIGRPNIYDEQRQRAAEGQPTPNPNAADLRTGGEGRAANDAAKAEAERKAKEEAEAKAKADAEAKAKAEAEKKSTKL